jgi:hypothetical protein
MKKQGQECVCQCVQSRAGPLFVRKKVRIFSQERERRSPIDTAFEDTQLSLVVFFYNC